jgi:hypothetical protein
MMVGGLQAAFYWADLAVAAGLLLLVQYRARRGGRRRRRERRLFWLGSAIGLLWEVPLFLSALYAADPALLFLRRPPLHPLLFMLAHALWDGGLFLVGVALLRRRDALEGGFRWRELGVLLLWGQLSALLVELSSVSNRAWVYAADRAWNPVLLHCAGEPLTLLPQLIWALAPLLFYGLALRLAAREAR